MVFIAAPLRWLEKNDKPPETGGDVTGWIVASPPDVNRSYHGAFGKNA
jgi:hypothetical protein